MSCTGEFGEHDSIATQILFGAPTRQGRHVFEPGEVFGVLGSELTHAGKRVRSWAFILQVPPGSSPPPAPGSPPETSLGISDRGGSQTQADPLPGAEDFRGPGAGDIPGVRMRFLDSVVGLLCALVQSRHHRKPGPVCDLVTCVEDLAERGCLDVVPTSFWTMAGITAAGGFGVRTPHDRDIQRWSQPE